MSWCRHAISCAVIYCIVYITFAVADNEEICSARPLDLVLVLDGSRSVLPRNFQLVKGYVKNFTTIFHNIGPETNQIGVVQYGSVVREEIRLNQFNNKRDLMNAVDNIVYMQTGTMTGEALKFMTTRSFSREHGARLDNPMVHRIAVIITDGRSQDYSRGTVTEWQRRAKESGIEIYSIGVGRKANARELTEIASEPTIEHKFHVRNFDAIHMVDVNVHDTTICDVDECVLETHSCSQRCVNTIGSYRCDCYDAFTLQSDGFSCFANDPCLSNPCSDTCIPVSPGVFRCECPTGMRLDFSAVNCVDLEECVENQHDCDQICINTDRSYECDCRYGYTLEDDGRTCTKMNPCLADPCSHSCSVESPGTFTCSCPENMQLDSSEVNCIALPAPTPSNLRFSRITHTSAKASWEVGDYDERFINHYVLVYTRADGQGQNTLLQITDRTADLVDLDPSGMYNVSVSAVTQEDFSKPVRGSFTTLSLGDTVVTLSNPTLTTLTANWEQAGGHGLTGYEIRYQRKEDPNSAGVGPPPVAIVRLVEADTLQLLLTGLTPDTPYSVKVIPLYGELFGATGMDEERTDTLGSPKVKIVNTTLSILEAAWGNISYQVSTWTAILTSDETGQTRTVEVSGDVNEFRFSDLLPSTRYSVQVNGHVIERGETFDSRIGSATGVTKSLDSPLVNITNTTQSTLTVEWQDINCQVDYWTVRIFPKGRNRHVETVEVDANERTTTFQQLRPATQYVTEVIGHVRENGKTFNSDPGRDTAITLPAPPNNIRVTDRGYTYLVANFQSSRGDADRYEAECVARTPDKTTVMATVTGLPPNYVIRCEGLRPATDYAMIVWTIYRDAESSHIFTANKTLSPAPSGLTLSEPSSTTLLVQWLPPQMRSDVNEYYVTYNSSDDDLREVTIPGHQNTLLLEDLFPNSWYDVEVTAVTNGEHSQPQKGSEKTLDELVLLTINGVDYHTVNVSWTLSAVRNMQHYVLTIYPLSKQNMVTEVTVPRNTNMFTFSDLPSATTYRVTLVAVYSASSNSNESTDTATTLSMPPIGPLTFSDVTESSFLVSWMVPESNIMPSSYVVTYSTPGSIPLTMQGVINSFLLLQELDPETTYNVTVFARYPGNSKSNSITGNVTTLSSIPGGCSCRAYLKTQARMHDTVFQLIQQIQILSERIDQLTAGATLNPPTEINGRNRRSRQTHHSRSQSVQGN